MGNGGRRNDLQASVLKIGHHGSQYASTSVFIAVHAQIATVSVGRHNTFGHPAPATLATLAHDPRDGLSCR